MRLLTSLLLSIALLGCTATQRAMSEADKDLKEGRVDAAQEKLESVSHERPDDFELRMKLADIHYLKARRALDSGNEEEYARELEASFEDALAAVEIDPRRAAPHLLMAVIAAYRGDMDASLAGFQNCTRLEPLQAVHYTNLAEVLIYHGRVSRARKAMTMARKLRAPGAALDNVEILAAWRRGDMVEAADAFNIALGVPGFAETWNLAPLPEPMETFEDYQNVCCNDPVCGQGMVRQCRQAEIAVAAREKAEETLREELRIEMERRRRLREIYDRHRDLEVVIEPSGEAPEEE